ncbi:MAG: hypothetical protein QW514_09475 [Thermoprotei archaeon]
MVEVSETIKISKEAKEGLIRVAASLQAREGRRVTLDEALKYLLRGRVQRLELLEAAFEAVPTLRVEDLYKERRRDERAAKRKYAL